MLRFPPTSPDIPESVQRHHPRNSDRSAFRFIWGELKSFKATISHDCIWHDINFYTGVTISPRKSVLFWLR